MSQVAYVICWWLALEVIGLVSFPLVSRVCTGLTDKGYSISKLVGLVILTYFTWMFSSLKILPFGLGSIILAFVLLAVLSVGFGRKQLRIADWPRKQIIISDAIFSAFFVISVLIMLGSPDIYFSGANDAYFNYAFIGSILRTDYFPPPDPWLAGASMPYYYGGHLLTAVLVTVTKVPPAISFNLAGAMFFALAIGAAYGLGYNITKRKLYGFLTAFFVCIVGYMAGAFQLMAFLSHHQILGYQPSGASNIAEWLLWFDFWTAPWLIDGAIVHYPYFSFLMGDLHSFFMSVPFQLMFIMLIFALFQKGKVKKGNLGLDTLLDIFILGLCLGFFSILNTWEYPTYVIFVVLAFVFLRIKPSIKGTLVVPVTIIIISFIFYLPYYSSGGVSGFRGMGEVMARTSLVQFFEFCALFLFVIFSLLFILAKREILRGKVMISIAIFILLATILAAVFLKFQLLIIVVPAILLSLYYIYKSKMKSEKEFVLLLIIMGAALALFCDLLYLDDALSGTAERFNTVMKLYHQMWVFLGISAALAVYYVLSNLGRKTKIVWVIVLVVLILASLVHPIASTTSMLSGRHTYWGMNRGTLDGMAYVERIDKGDYDAIRWMNEQIKGTPVILEAPGNPTVYAGRVSTFTGLPTVIGWGSWEIMWRQAWAEVDQRLKDVKTIYNTLDNDEAMRLLRKYDVRYIYVGTAERKTYEDVGLQKFAAHPEKYQLVYENEGVTIFKVREE